MSNIREKLDYLINKLKNQNNFDIAIKIENNKENIVEFYKQKLLEINNKIMLGDYWFSFYKNQLWFFVKDNDDDIVLKEKKDLDFFINFDKYINDYLKKCEKEQQERENWRLNQIDKLSIEQLKQRIKNYQNTMILQNKHEAQDTQKWIDIMKNKLEQKEMEKLKS